MNIFRKISIAIVAFVCNTAGYAAIPDGYYSSCEGKYGQELLEALCSTISSHTTVSYNGLWDLYKTSDIDENGKIWDMYSTKRWTPGSEQCGTYKNIGDCYNREHSFPKSWFNEASPMVSDAFHIYPTDGKVNGQRSNYPFGECSGGTSVASSGGVQALGKLGSSTFSGYSGKVFEPVDEYKGDFARSYFYMAACYNNKIASWSSDMLAGNSYPAFKTWAVNLLLKWTRQDEVSKKETDRQEVVYGKQKNRNPFIDHPELAEHIWGNKNTTPWYSTTTATPTLAQPVDGSTLDLGYAAVNVERSVKIMVKGSNVEETCYLFTNGAGFSVSPETLTPAQVNQGYNVTVSLTSASAGNLTGSLNVICGDLTSEVTLKANVVDGLPMSDAKNITPEGFDLQWADVKTETEYELHVLFNGQEVTGFPEYVAAADEEYTVTGLEPETTYTFYLTDGTLTSEVKTVTTAALIPSIDILYDGEPTLSAEPGTPSDPAELLIEIENIADPVTLTVQAPFEISTDKTNWTTTLTLGDEEDRFYLRVNSASEGNFSTSIVATAGTYMADDAEFTATVATAPVVVPGVVEDFEAEGCSTTDVKTYSTTTFQGTAYKWSVKNGGFGTGSQDTAVNGSNVLRMNYNAAGTWIAMNENQTSGVGTVTFDAAKWPNSGDAAAVVAVEYSADSGSTWTEMGSVTISETDSKQFSVAVNKLGTGRVRFNQKSGKRWFIDNISIPGFTETGAIETVEYHQWDAYCLDGQLVIENGEQPRRFSVYGVDGLTWLNDRQLPAGSTTFDLPRGLYIVVSNDFVRRVLVK